jgi:hypothetical protein
MIDENEIRKLERWSREGLSLLVSRTAERELQRLREENLALREELDMLKNQTEKGGA